MSGQAQVFAIPVGERVLVHAPLHALQALVNRVAAHRLQDALAGPVRAPPALADLVAALRRPVEAPRPSHGPPEAPFLGIVPTRACNLGCHYCDFSAAGGTGAVIEAALAAAAIDWMVEHARRRGRREVEIHLFGGEPLVAPEVVEICVHRARVRAAAAGLAAHLEVTTNGAFGRRRARWVGDHFDAVVVSLDGPAEVHDRHRPAAGGGGSFATVSAAVHELARTETELCLRCCVSELSVDRLEATCDWMCRTFQPASIDLETMQPTARALAAGLRPPDPVRFATAFAAAARSARRHGVEAVYAAAQGSRPRLSFCPVGSDAVIVDPGGLVSSCYLPDPEWRSVGLDLEIGAVSATSGLKLDSEAVIRLRRMASPARCSSCFCRFSCAGGCHVRRAAGQAGGDAFCVQTRLITAWGLLAGLGVDGEAVLADPDAVAAVAYRGSDRLEDWGTGQPLETPPAPAQPPAGGDSGLACAASGTGAAEPWPARPGLDLAPGVRWLVDRASVVVVHGECVIRLPYPHAAVWDLLALARSRRRVAEQLAVIAGLSLAEAQGLVEEDLARWRRLGLVGHG